MSYLYNMFEGSLATISPLFNAVDLTDVAAVRRAVLGDHPDPRDVAQLGLDRAEMHPGIPGPLVLDALIYRHWTQSTTEVLCELDWHEQDELLERARPLLSRRGSALLTSLFTSPPLGVDPFDWGFCGSLTYAEVTELRDELVAALPPEVVNADFESTDGELAEGWPVEIPLSWVLLTLRRVTDGCDLAVRLG